MRLKDTEGIANSVDFGQTALLALKYLSENSYTHVNRCLFVKVDRL